MNNDLISRKYVICELLKEREHYPPMVAERYSFGVKLAHHFNQAMRGGIRKGLRIAETAPAIDAVEVVRCGDCKHWGTGYGGETENVKVCEYANYMIGKYGYCAYVEAKSE